MQEQRERSALTMSPSFRAITGEEEDDADRFIPTVHFESPDKIPAADRPVEQDQHHQEEGGDDSSDDFEFAFVLRDPVTDPSITADDIFSNGQIRPVYPVFNRNLLLSGSEEAEAAAEGKAIRLPLRRLLIEDRDGASCSSSEADELEGVPSETYCVWAPRSVPPSPDRCKKSSSTGSSSRRWRLRDLVVGRSQSDGKEKFVFLSADEKKNPNAKLNPNPNPNPNPIPKAAKKVEEGEKKEMGKGSKVTEVDMVTAHRLYYGKNNQAVKSGRRSFLPYRVGFFANANGLSF